MLSGQRKEMFSGSKSMTSSTIIKDLLTQLVGLEAEAFHRWMKLLKRIKCLFFSLISCLVSQFIYETLWKQRFMLYIYPLIT